MTAAGLSVARIAQRPSLPVLVFAGLSAITLTCAIVAGITGSRIAGLACLGLGLATASIAVWALKPVQLLALWGGLLLVYVLWPTQTPDYAFDHLSIEYLGLLTIAMSVLLSAFWRRALEPAAIPKQLIYPAILFLLFAIASGIWTPDHESWIEYTVMWFIYMFLLFGLAATVVRLDGSDLNRAFSVIATCVTVFGLVGVVRAQFPSLIHGGVDYYSLFAPIVRFRVSEDLSLLLGITLNIYLYSLTRRPVYIALLLITAVCVVLSFSRTGAVGLAVMVLVLGVVYRGRRYKRVYVAAAVGVVLLTLLVLVGFKPIVDVFSRVASTSVVMQIWFGSVNINDPGGGRQAVLQEGFRIFREKPWLGTGVGNYMSAFNNALPTTHTTPHNIYVESLAEYGVVGSALIFTLWAGLVYVAWRRALLAVGAWRSLLVAFAAMDIALIVMGLGTEFFTLPYFWFSAGLGLGLALRPSTPVE